MFRMGRTSCQPPRAWQPQPACQPPRVRKRSPGTLGPSVVGPMCRGTEWSQQTLIGYVSQLSPPYGTTQRFLPS